MEESINYSYKQIKKLQIEAKSFLTQRKLILNGVSILPKEIEVYFYKEGEFEDTSVHRNELQRKNKNHFYIHRTGTTQYDKYKGGNRGGLDFVVSDEEDVYYSYLIRSALINNNLVIGPHNVLENIIMYCKLKRESIEKEPVLSVLSENPGDVFFSERINLGQNAGKFIKCKLRTVLCDEWFRCGKYPAKEKMIVEFLLDEKMSGEESQKYAKKNLGYIPSSIKKV